MWSGRSDALRRVAAVALLALWPGPSGLIDLIAHPIRAHMPPDAKLIAVGVFSPFFVPLKVLFMVGVLLVLPWLDTSPVRSARFRPVFRWLIWVWALAFIILGVCGAHKPEGIWVVLSRVATLYYFLHFLIVMPIVGLIETPKPIPDSIAKSVLATTQAE